MQKWSQTYGHVRQHYFGGEIRVSITSQKILSFGTILFFTFLSVQRSWAEDKKYGLVDYGKEVPNASMVHSVPEPFDLQHDNARFTIVKAEILKLTTPYSTPEKPAQGRIKILKVLRGRNKKVPREADATFSAPYLDGIKRKQKYTMPKPGDLVMI